MEKEIKQSNAAKVGGTNGSLGGATPADLERGYITSETDGESAAEEAAETVRMPDGFVGRPMGWDR